MNEKDFLEHKKFILYMLTKDPDSIKYWDTYLMDHPEDENSFIKAKQTFKKLRVVEKKLSNEEKDTIQRNIFKNSTSIKTLRNKRRLNKLYYAVAASILIVLIFKFKTNKPEKNNEVILVKKTEYNQEIELVANNKTYTLVNNETLNVSKNNYLNSDSKKIKKTNKPVINTLKVPFGKRSKLILADGSKLWVNAGTTVKFPSSFNKTKRSIYVDGEIYIEVTKDKTKPFVVQTLDLEVNVYGTVFNVNAYSKNTKKEVVLTEGSVGITTKNNEEVMMIPNELVEFNENKITKKNVNPNKYTSWRKGYLTFKNKPLNEILNELSSYYNVTFTNLNKEQKANLCTGKIYLSTNIDDVLETLAALSDTSYKVMK